MTIETSTYISQLDATYPASGDPKSEGDDHIRKIKANLLATFPNLTAAAVTPTTTELNYVDGVTSAIQTQLDAKMATSTLAASGGAALVGFLQAGTGANATTAQAKLREIVSVKDFGAVGDGSTDDTAAFQEAVDYCAGLAYGGCVIVPHSSSYYSVDTLDAKSNVTVYVPNRATRIVCDKTSADFLETVCWRFGGYDFNFDTPTAYAISDITAGGGSLTFTTSGDSANFAAGDVIWIETTTNYTITTYDVPMFYQMNIVTSVGSGTVGLYHSIQGTHTGCRVRRLTRNGGDNAIHNFKLIGGTWENTTATGAFGVSGGIINSEISPDVVIASYGCVYGNGFAHITSNIKTMRTDYTPIGIALGSHNITLHVDNIAVNNASSLSRLIEVSESTRGNKITVNNLTAAAAVEKVVQVIASKQNSIHVGTFAGSSVTAAVVEVWGPVYPTRTGIARSSDNVIEVANVNCDSVAYGVSYSGSASPDTYCEGNKVSVGLKTVYNTSTPTASPSTLAQKNLTQVQSLSYWAAKYNEYRTYGDSASSASPFSRSCTFTANTLKTGDTLRLKITGVTSGAAGTKTITITFAGNTVYTRTIVSTSGQPFTINATITAYSNTVAIGNTMDVVNITPGSQDYGQVSLNFTTTDYSLVVAGTCASSGDLISFREVSLDFYRPFANGGV